MHIRPDKGQALSFQEYICVCDTITTSGISGIKKPHVVTERLSYWGLNGGEKLDWNRHICLMRMMACVLMSTSSRIDIFWLSSAYLLQIGAIIFRLMS